MNNFNSKKYVDNLFLQESNYKYKREIFDELYNKLLQTNISLIGLRHVGKTTLMVQLAKKYYDEYINMNQNLKSSIHNNKDKILYLNLKSIPNVNDQKVWNELFDEITKSKYKLILLDEVQEIKEWTNLLESAIDLNKNCKFIICTSNDIALTKNCMVGRVKAFYIQPLMYNEFLEIWGLNDNEKSIHDYLKFGSFPKTNISTRLATQYREIIEQSIIDEMMACDLKNEVDIIEFKKLLKIFSDCIGDEIDISSINKVINISQQTINNYLIMMERMKLIKVINNYGENNYNEKYKVYYEDKSLIYLFSNKKSNSNLMTFLVENIVFNYLCNKFLNHLSLTEINYFKTKENKEINFVINDKEILLKIDYTNNLDSIKVSKELNKAIDENLKFKNFKKIVITKNINETNVNGWEFISFNNFLKNGISNKY